jgi:predicted nucleic acid-binding protein
MIFAQLPQGCSVFLDANTLVYHFQPHPLFAAACNQLLARIENQDFAGFTSTHTLTEVAHRLMMMEAASLPGWQPTKVKRRLIQKPAIL